MVARFHEGCLHRRVDGQIEEFIFTEASPSAIASWVNHIERMMLSPECPEKALWLLDFRLSGPLPVTEVTHHMQRLQEISSKVGKQLQVAYISDTPEIFEGLYSTFTHLVEGNTRCRWFNGSYGQERREEALEWLFQTSRQLEPQLP